MFDKLEAVVQRFEALTEKMADPTLYERQDEYKQVSSERGAIEEVVTVYKQYKASKEQLEEAEIQLEAVEAEREALTRWIFLLQQNVASTENQAVLEEVSGQTQSFNELFALQGWIAVRDTPQLESFAEQKGLVLLLEDPIDSESPPTLLENSVAVGGGQEVVSFFQTPSYRSWDPSRVVFFSFVIF